MIDELEFYTDEIKQFLFDNKIDININDPFSKNIIYSLNDKIVGILNYSIIYERAEINYIFVLPDYRNKKIASKLLDVMIKKCKICENITLEVRKSNDIAINLYVKYGFEKVAIRKNYYKSEDGILMMLVVK